MIRKNCNHCNRLFKTYRDKAKYCCHTCYTNEKWLKARVVQYCGNCGCGFLARKEELKRGKGKYCSRKCAKLGQRQLNNIECKVCGNSFYVPPAHREYGSNGREYCSIECKTEDGWETRSCKRCSKDFEVIKSKTNEFCSLSCSSQYNNPTLAMLNKFNMEKSQVPKSIIEANVEVYELKRQTKQAKQ